jgi:hypothetical protein
VIVRYEHPGIECDFACENQFGRRRWDAMQAMGRKWRRLQAGAAKMSAIPLACNDLYTCSSRWQLLSAKEHISSQNEFVS